MSVPNGNFPVDYHKYLQDILDEAEATAADAESSANIRANPYAVLVAKGLAPPNGSVPANGLVPVDDLVLADDLVRVDSPVPVDGLVPADGLAPVNSSPNVAANASSMGCSNAFNGEVINVQQSEGSFYIPNSVLSQGHNNVAGTIPSGFQYNQQQILQQMPTPQMSPPQLPTPDGVPPCGESVDSLFHAPSPLETRMLETPSTSPEYRPVAMKIPISTPTKKKPRKKSTPRSKTTQSKAISLVSEMSGHKILNSVHLPRALATATEYSQHVSPFAPINPTRCAKAPQAGSQLDKARRRIQDLTQERSYYQRVIRQATDIDPQTGKTDLETLRTQNANLKRVNSTHSTNNKQLQAAFEAERQRYIQLANKFNMLVHDLQTTQQENMKMKARLGSS